jgi:ubiquinone/menaquinone biosynthesis C-methylase UbiE
MVHGMSPWELTKIDKSYNDAMNSACVADSNLMMDVVMKEARGIFQGLSSLIDVGGGHGIATMAIAKEFPEITCSVLDLEQVIEKAPRVEMVKYIIGDMFQFIPSSGAVLLKVIFCHYLLSVHITLPFS